MKMGCFFLRHPLYIQGVSKKRNPFSKFYILNTNKARYRNFTNITVLYLSTFCLLLVKFSIKLCFSMHGKKCTIFLIGVFLDVEFKSEIRFFRPPLLLEIGLGIGEKIEKITLNILNNGVFK